MADDIKRVIGIVAIISAMLFVGILIAALIDENLDKAKKALIISGSIMLVSTIAVIFTPDKQTTIEMQVARFATYENAQWTLETIKAAVDYIVDAVAKIK